MPDAIDQCGNRLVERVLAGDVAAAAFDADLHVAGAKRQKFRRSMAGTSMAGATDDTPLRRHHAIKNDYLKSDRICSGLAFAIFRDWIANCCCVCSAFSRVDAWFMSVSTSRPMPRFRLSIKASAKSR
jgi:hypothetical protein